MKIFPSLFSLLCGCVLNIKYLLNEIHQVSGVVSMFGFFFFIVISAENYLDVRGYDALLSVKPFRWF